MSTPTAFDPQSVPESALAALVARRSSRRQEPTPNRAPASAVAAIDRLVVALVAVFALAFLGERPSGGDWLGIGLETLGWWCLRGSGRTLVA